MIRYALLLILLLLGFFYFIYNIPTPSLPFPFLFLLFPSSPKPPQADSKALVGSYICSDVPGEFIWAAGAVTQAVEAGGWVVIENVEKVRISVIVLRVQDTAHLHISYPVHAHTHNTHIHSSMDIANNKQLKIKIKTNKNKTTKKTKKVPLEILASLASLIERRALYHPQLGREVACHPNFRLFASRTLPSAPHQSDSIDANQEFEFGFWAQQAAVVGAAGRQGGTEGAKGHNRVKDKSTERGGRGR